MTAQRDRINEELEHIRDEHGGTIKQVDVVNYARNPNTELHSQFEWDDSVAGEAYRLQQAARIIRSYIVSVSTPRGPKKMRRFVSLMMDRQKGAESPGYRGADDVFKDEELRPNFFMTVYLELMAVKRKYESLREFDSVMKKFDLVWKALDLVVSRYENRQRPRSAENDRPSA